MLEARGLRVPHPQGRLALDGVTIMAHRGEVVAIVGSTGSGKSTLLRVIAGVVAPQAGTVILDHVPVDGLPPHRRAARGITYAPEHARILPGLSVVDNLLIGAWLRRDRRAVGRDLDRIFEWFPALRARPRRPAETLSRSDRQLVAIGRGVMAAPHTLLLGEPFVGLDAADRARVAAVVRILKSDERAVLLTAPDPAPVQEIADRAYGLRSGRLVFSGSAAAMAYSAALKESYG